MIAILHNNGAITPSMSISNPYPVIFLAITSISRQSKVSQTYSQKGFKAFSSHIRPKQPEMLAKNVADFR
jgi:hypothetical protein